MAKTEVHLTKGEVQSAAWQKVDAYLNAELSRLRALNENPRKTEDERIGWCWRIYEIKELLKLASQPAEPQQDAG